MSKGRFEKPKQRKFPFVIFALVLFVVVLAVLFFHRCSAVPENIGDPAATEATVEKNKGSISIPGFEMLELQADSKNQTICLSNPAQNNCYFQISLYLEDGTLLWQSELIEPGEITEPLVLSEKLAKGYYPGAVLQYSCYRMDEELSPLNGAEMKVTLWVK